MASAREVAESLLEPADVEWTENSVPLPDRGVRLRWLCEFGATLNDHIVDTWDRFSGQQRASMHCDWVPEPDPPAGQYSLSGAEDFVSRIVKPLTMQASLPLFARVPQSERGSPSVFVSHTWSSQLYAGGHGSLDIALDRHADDFIWIDIISYSQHLVNREHVAAGMQDVIASIGSASAILTTKPFFTRSWCTWELVCGHTTGADYRILDNVSCTHKYFVSEAGMRPPRFQSVDQLEGGSLDEVRQIHDELVSAFGSVAAADEFTVSRLRDLDMYW